MKNINDKDLADAIKKQQKSSGMLDKDSFWDEFNEKVKHIKQDAEVKEPIVFLAGWAKAAACFILAAGLITGLLFWNRSDRQPDNLAVIQDYEIFSDHTGVLIIEDDEEAGTILWVTGLNNNSTGG